MEISNQLSIFEKGLDDNIIKGKVTLICLYKSKKGRVITQGHPVISNDDITMWIRTNDEGKALCPLNRF